MFGNVEVEKCTRNALKIIDVAQRADVPAYQGSAKPLMREPHYAKSIHGEDGLGDVGFDPPAFEAAPGRADGTRSTDHGVAEGTNDHRPRPSNQSGDRDPTGASNR